MNLYLVTGEHATATVELYVLSKDAGEAESLAKQTWLEWDWMFEPVNIKLVGTSRRYGPNGITTVVFSEWKQCDCDPK